MTHKVTVNGEIVIITSNLKRAVSEYNKAIYRGKSGDFIVFFSIKTPDVPYELIRKDWL